MNDSKNTKPILRVALGGNALIKKGQEGNAVQQLLTLKVTVRQISRLSKIQAERAPWTFRKTARGYRCLTFFTRPI